MTKFKAGDRVFLKETTKVLLGAPEGVVFTISDILLEDVPFQIVIQADEFGKDWVQFVKEDERIMAE